MRVMLILSTLFSLMISCEKTPVPATNVLNGSWGLVQTELYKNDTLNGSAPASKITTYYQFENCGEDDWACRLVITEDGNETSYNYLYSAKTQELIINESNQYHVETLTENSLVFHKEYEPYKSVYTFQKVE